MSSGPPPGAEVRARIHQDPASSARTVGRHRRTARGARFVHGQQQPSHCLVQCTLTHKATMHITTFRLTYEYHDKTGYRPPTFRITHQECFQSFEKEKKIVFSVACSLLSIGRGPSMPSLRIVKWPAVLGHSFSPGSLWA